jgi:crotonobetainyl-CoA:carnitine CoA-transferase CaiB-like acyl-CoA transferase
LLAAPEVAQTSAINDLDAAPSDRHVTARGMLILSQASDLPASLVASALHFSRTPITYDRPAPALGSDTAMQPFAIVIDSSAKM